MPYLQLAPRQPWEPCGQACSFQTIHWLPRDLADYNPRSANPSDVWANDSVYHNPPAQGRGEKGNYSLFSVKMHRSKPAIQATIPFLREAACLLLVMALFPVSLAQAGTYPHGWYLLFKLQSERFFFPVRPIAQKKRQNITRVKNIFLIFFANGKSAY